MSHLHVPVGPEDHVQGNPHAPVTLLEYGDYECPYCGTAYSMLKEVQRRMGDSLRFVFRNFPLTEMHPHAAMAAEAAEAAGVLGQFWPMHDMLYEHQDALDLTHLLGYAKSFAWTYLASQRTSRPMPSARAWKRSFVAVSTAVSMARQRCS